MVTAGPTADPFEPGLCRVHPAHPAAHGYRTCDECSTAMRDALDDIVRLYPTVVEEVLFGATSDDGPRGATVFQSGPPVNLARIDRGQRLLDEDVMGVVAWWADAVRESVGQPARRGRWTLTGEVVVLVRWWSWIRKQDAVGDLGRELFRLRRTLENLAAETRGRIRLGPCPTLLDATEPGRAGGRCGELLHARPGESAVRCPRCSTNWHRYRWDELADAQEAAQ